MKYARQLWLTLVFLILMGCQSQPSQLVVSSTATPSPVPPGATATLTPMPTESPAQAISIPVAPPTMTPRPIVELPTHTPSLTHTPLPPTPSPTTTPSPVPSPTTPSVDAEVTEIGDGLRLRAGPGLSASVLANLPAGAKLQFIGRTSDGGWYQVVTTDNKTGWVWGAYLRIFTDVGNVPITGDTIQNPTVPAPSGVSVVSGVSSHARQIFERGQQMGNRRDVFSKVGDSLTVATFVLYPIGWGSYNLGNYQHLQTAVNFFSGTAAREGNSFANISLAADNGWTTREILDPSRARGGVCQGGETPLECEYRVVKPSVALILVGTNDVANVPLNEYSSNLQRIVQITIDRGIIPIVSTIPNRSGFDVTPYNQAIRQIAASNDIPLWDYWSAMQLLPNFGLHSDGVHPSYPSETDFAQSANFSDPNNLQYGYVIRNLTALEVLDAVWRFVLSY